MTPLGCVSLISCFVIVDFVRLPDGELLGWLSVVTSVSSTGPTRKDTKQMPLNDRRGGKTSPEGVPNSQDYRSPLAFSLWMLAGQT